MEKASPNPYHLQTLHKTLLMFREERERENNSSRRTLCAFKNRENLCPFLGKELGKQQDSLVSLCPDWCEGRKMIS